MPQTALIRRMRGDRNALHEQHTVDERVFYFSLARISCKIFAAGIGYNKIQQFATATTMCDNHDNDDVSGVVFVEANSQSRRT